MKKQKFLHFTDLLQQRAINEADKVLFRFLADGEQESDSLTCQQLDYKARIIAAHLQYIGCQPEERVLLLYQPSLEYITAFFGCLYAGVIAVPAYPPRINRSLERLQSIVDDSSASYALTTSSLLEGIKGKLFCQSTEDLNCIATDTLPESLAEKWVCPTINPKNLAFLQYTSGSTGIPKGVMVSHENLIYNSYLINLAFEDTEKSKGVFWLPPYHDMGLIGGILQPIYLGRPAILLPPVTFLQRPLRWLQAISDYQVTTSGGPNFAYELCLSQITPEQRDNLDLSSWELAFTGAEPVREYTLKRFAEYFAPCGFRLESFYPCYGMAETTLIITGGKKQTLPVYKTIDSKALERNQVRENENGITLVGCGKTLDQQKILIVNPETLETTQEIGEVWVKGASVAQGYWNRPTQTQEIFNAYTQDTKEGPFLRTGDLGFISPQSEQLFITGRLKDLIIIRGRNHYPNDIELTVEKSHPSLREGCGAAFAIEGEDTERLVIIYEVKRTALRKLNVQEVTETIRRAIITNHDLQPHAIVLLKTGSIPKTSSGKIQRHACRVEFLQENLSIVGEWKESVAWSQQTRDVTQSTPNTQHPIPNTLTPNIVKWLVNKLAERLGVAETEIDIREPFVNYGLDSVQAVRLSAELEDWLGTKLSPTLVYDYPNIESLAQYLREQNPTPNPHTQHPLAHTQHPIAIVGMGCRFPQANSPQEFWQVLSQGQDCIVSCSSRWTGEEQAGLISDCDLFDARFFGISHREAIYIDPQQRLLLEVSWQALENAAIAPSSLAGSNTGVFIGISSSDYSQLSLLSNLETNPYLGTGNAHSIAANRLSYFYDLRGPSIAIDTACSSSLVALHLACQSIQAGECEIAIVGGVNLILTPQISETFKQAGMLAIDGRCKTFDSQADGYVRGEGCGVVILKRFSAALENGNPIAAIIRGSAINQDGRSNGLTAPNGQAQQKVINSALQAAQCLPQDISYVETHGTGTPLGDPIEVNSLKQVLFPHRTNNLYLGSVKTNIGHLEAAAGIAGVIKTVLSLQQQEIPANLHLNTINPHLDLEGNLIQIPKVKTPWTLTPRLAGVSSFGFGGTNAHIILEEYTPLGQMGRSGDKGDNLPPTTYHRQPTTHTLPPTPYSLFTLSGQNEEALSQLVEAYQKIEEKDIQDICYTVNTGRTHLKHRLCLVVQSFAELQEKLSDYKTHGILGTISQAYSQKNLAFLFTGQGSQEKAMGKELWETNPTFRTTLETCDEILQEYLEVPLREVLYGSRTELLEYTLYTQPALFAIEYSLAKLWESWGITPNLVMGHSIGEYVAATIAGVFSLADGLKLIAKRAYLMQNLSQFGSMCAVFAQKEAVQAALEPWQEKVSIAAYNGYENLVISGETAAVQEVVNLFKEQGIKTRKLKVSQAFHSPLMDGILADFAQVANQITYSLPQIPLISNLTGELITTEIAQSSYWVNHVRQPVQFVRSIEYLERLDYKIYLEIGPKPTLLGMARSLLEPKGDANQKLVLPSLRSGQQGDWVTLLQSLALLHTNGINIDWQGFSKDYKARPLDLPTYPFQKERYWIETTELPLTRDKEDTEGRRQEAGGRRQESGSRRQEGVRTQPALETYKVVWEKATNPKTQNPNPQPQTPKWLILADQGGLAQEIARVAEQKGITCHLIYPDKSNFPLAGVDLEEEIRGVQTILHLWNLDTLDLETAQTRGCQTLLQILQLLLAPGGQQQQTKIWTLTRGVQPTPTNKVEDITASTLWGLSKVISLELPELWGGIIDLDQQNYLQSANEILQEILFPDIEGQIALIRGERYIPRLEHWSEGKSSPFNPSTGSYLITGAFGSLGLKLADSLIQQGVRSLLLLGRSAPSAKANLLIKTWQEEGIEILAEQVDISDLSSLEQFLHQSKEKGFPTLKGIFQLAGVLSDRLLVNMNWEDFTKVMEAKVQGSWNLHQLTLQEPLEYFVMFSSVASVLGSPGQGNYAASNAFMDSLAHKRQNLGLPALSINLGPLTEGMTRSINDVRLSKKGILQTSPEAAYSRLFSLLGDSQVGQLPPQIGLFQADWEELGDKYSHLPIYSFLEKVAPRRRQTNPTVRELSLFEHLSKIGAQERAAKLQEYLLELVAKMLQIPKEKISTNASLLDLGMDSLMIMDALGQLKRELQLMIYPREIYEHPRLNALAQYLASEFERSYGNRQSSGAESVRILPQPPTPTPHTPHPTPYTLPPALFILSSPRSGSTLLRVMLAGHPQLSSPPELHLLPFNTMQEREAELGQSHLGEGLQRALMELKGIDAASSQAIVEEWVKENKPIYEIYEILQELAKEKILVDKSPTYANSRQTLERGEIIFAGAKYIHLVRHPYAVIESFSRMRMERLVTNSQVNPYQLAEEIWTQSNQNTLEFLATVPNERHHRIYYEELVTDPQGIMQSLCEFLEIEFTPTLLNPYQGDRMTDGVYTQSMSVGDPNFLQHNQIEAELAEAWRNIHLPITLQPISRQIAATLNYQLPNEPTSPQVTREESFLTVKGINLCICRWQQSQPLPIVLCLHGLLEQGAVWQDIAEDLVRQGYQVIAPDLRGHGLSAHIAPDSSYQLLDFLADLQAIIEQFCPEPIILVGHSFGAALAALYTSVRPQKVKRLVLLEPPLPADFSERSSVTFNLNEQLNSYLDYAASTIEHPIFPNQEAAINRLKSATPALNDQRATDLAARILEPVEGGFKWRWDPRLRIRMGLTLNNFLRTQFLELLAAIKVPTVLIQGEGSPFNRPEDLADLTRVFSCSHKVSGGHNLHLEASSQVARLIGE